MNWPFLTIISQIAVCSFFVPFTTTILSGVQTLFHLSTHANTLSFANFGVLTIFVYSLRNALWGRFEDIDGYYTLFWVGNQSTQNTSRTKLPHKEL